MNTHKVYSDEYRGIVFEIKETPASDYHQEMGHTNCWTHYIYIRLDKQIKDKSIADKFWLEPYYDNKGRHHYRYYDSIVGSLDLHGGCTWYSKESSPDHKERIVKIGCDYQHLWDEGNDYSLEFVVAEARNTIDSLWEITDINRWCPWCGSWLPWDKHKDGRCENCKNES